MNPSVDPMHDHPTVDDVLQYQMSATFQMQLFPSGSIATILTPGQLAYLEEITRGTEDPRGEALRLILNLDEPPRLRILPGQRA